MARTQSKKYPEVRESMLKSAARLFATKGYPNTTIIDLANACNSSRGALYHYFDSKEQILIEIFETHLTSVLAELEAVAAAEREPMPAFRALMRRLMRMNSENQAEQITLLNEMNQVDAPTRANFALKQKQIVTPKPW
jgi:AcrR family transcriptional regulator